MSGALTCRPLAPVHHLPGHRAIPEGHPPTVADTDAGKLDKALDILTDVQVKVGQTAVRVEDLTTAHQQVAGELGIQRQDLADLRDRVTSLEHAPGLADRLAAVETRPLGVTPRQLWAALGSAAAAAAALVAVLAFLLDHVRLT